MVQTISRVNSNLWRRAQGRRFPIGGLVFYAPLWHPELNGSPFLSKDLNAHSCTVTGATWGIQGRTFDGVDDKIRIPDHATLNFGTGDFSIWAWVKLAASQLDTYPMIVSKENEAPTRAGYSLMIENATPTHFIMEVGSGGSFATAVGTTDLATGVFHFVLGVKTSTAVLVYTNMGTPVTTAHTLGSTDKAYDLAIGNKATVADRAFSGDIGEVGMISKALTLGEGQNIRLATKWRYQ